MSTTTTTTEIPPWARDCFRGIPSAPPRGIRLAQGQSEIETYLLEGPGLILASYRIADAVHMSPEAFEKACFQIYQQLREDLRSLDARFPVRLWNFIPQILEPLGELDHRYMVFNAGRFRALRQWLGTEQLASRVATASGVGHFGTDLAIHCLAADYPGEPVENPRQLPAYRYSEKFGPLPPCFARATRWHSPGHKPRLLVGGTASVRGEDSCHGSDLRRQLDETLYNLAAVVRSGDGIMCPNLSPDDVRNSLQRYLSLRIYLIDPAMQPEIEERLAHFFPSRTGLEFVHADLCRPELLVEIEGVAQLDA